MPRGDSITSVPGIGPKTEKELRRAVRGSRSPKTGDVTVDEVVRKSGTGILKVHLGSKQREKLSEAANTSKVLTQSDQQRMRSERSSEVNRDPSQVKPVGDFGIVRSDRQKAFEFHQDRSEVAQRVDGNRRAKVTDDFEQWSSDPSQFDFPGIDTPSRKPRLQERDLDEVNESSLLRDAEDVLDL